MTDTAKPVTQMWCDESGSRDDRFLLTGGIVIDRPANERIRSLINRYKRERGIQYELKFHKLKHWKLEDYKYFADCFFRWLDADIIHFHAIIFDAQAINRLQYPGASRVSMTNKLYYQLSLHRLIGYYGRYQDLELRPDRANALEELPDFKEALNHEARVRFRHPYGPLKSIELRDSESEPLLQLNDIILGAISHHRNQRHLRPNASSHKQEFVEYVREKTGLSNFRSNTPYRQRKFTIWNLVSSG